MLVFIFSFNPYIVSVDKLFFPQSNFCHKIFFESFDSVCLVFECVNLLPVQNVPFSIRLIKSIQTQWLAFAGTSVSLSCTGAS